jgi:predicted N-acetyltransferase YhbS
MSFSIRPITDQDAEVCGRIGFEAHLAISSAHGYPPEQPSAEFGVTMIRMLLANPFSWGALAERNGEIVGSIFLNTFPPAPVAVIGPLTVHPKAEGGAGRTLMDAALGQAKRNNYDSVRLVQSPSHLRSFVLYTKSGFVLREPLFLMQGAPLAGNNSPKGRKTRAASLNDIPRCNELCTSTHGFAREGELRHSMEQGAATIVERGGEITGYAAGVGLLCHAVAQTNEDLMALISYAPAFLGPGFFVPARNYPLLSWCLKSGFRIAWPANLMSKGDYQEPMLPFLPSLAY